MEIHQRCFCVTKTACIFSQHFPKICFCGKNLIFYYQHSDTVSVGAIKWMATDHRNSPGKNPFEGTPFTKLYRHFLMTCKAMCQSRVTQLMLLMMEFKVLGLQLQKWFSSLDTTITYPASCIISTRNAVNA